MLAPTTELEAVNSMLASIGESPVTRLEDTGVVDSALALQTLRATNREVQGAGWHFNTDTGYPLSPVFPEKEVRVPSNAIEVYPSRSEGNKDITVRGRRLYDRKNHTYKFDQTIKVEMISLLPFEDIPQFARNYIAIRAARIFQQNTIGSQELTAFKERDEVQALVVLKEAEAETGDYNVLSDSYSIAGVLHR